MSDLYSTGIRPAVDDWLLAKAKEVRSYGDYWSASSAGYCMRKNIFERLKVPYVTEDARKQRVFTSGHLFHQWMQGITKEAGLSIAQELELQDESLMIRGHIDDLVLINDKLMLIDYKTVSSRSFGYKHDLSYYHKMQLGTYMYMLRKLNPKEQYWPTDGGKPDLTEGRILLISKDDLRQKEQQLMWSDELESEVLNYWKALNDHWKKKTLPKCTCAAQENGFMAKEAYNPYFYKGEPCSLEYYKEWKAKELTNAH